MSADLGTERLTVQEPLIRYSDGIGWDYISREKAFALRKGEGGVFFYAVLARKLVELNPGIVTETNVDDIIQRLENVRGDIEGNAETLAWLRGKRAVYVAAQQRNRNVTLIDFTNPDRNAFNVTDEWRYTNGVETNRADVMFLINGIPVAIVETKSAREKDAIEIAITQMRRYHRETPEMVAAAQVFDVTEIFNFYYGVTWNINPRNLFNWKDEEKGNFEKKVKRFFERERFLKMLKEWILFFVKDDELCKTVLRQHQVRAVEKILKRCADKEKTRALIWHTQGAGKTFTMLIAARLILENRDLFGKATVLLVIDRNELEGQLAGWVDRLLGEMAASGIAIEHATGKRKLRKLLEAEFRGLIVSMIHKFDQIRKEVSIRDNVYVLIDEAHRSTGGDLGNYLVGALVNATLIGFTGTPIDKTAHGQGTFKVFGCQDEKGYLDKYSPAESIEDGTTLKLEYSFAPSEMNVPKEQLEEEFLNIVEGEGVSDIDDLNKILDRAVNLKNFLKSKDRVKKVAAFVAEHYKKNVEPLGYKAFLVCVDREACALYKEALDKLLPKNCASAVYTPAHNDSERYPLVHKYQLSRPEEKKQRRIFKQPDADPKIFIVTDKLLTGFDAPILYCMYLDKPMRDHVLLQAIARVNRPYESEQGMEKPCGLVVDFIGIFSRLEKALAFDADVVSGVIENIDVLQARFVELMTGPAQRYVALTLGKVDDKAVERAIEAFADKIERETFFSFFKELQTLYEILSPSPELRDFVEDMRTLAVLCQIVRNAFKQTTFLYGDLAQKTKSLMQEKVTSSEIGPKSAGVTIDEETLKALKKSDSPDSVKVVNLINGIGNMIAQEGNENPFLIPIGERAEHIRETYDDRQCSSEDALAGLTALVKEIAEARKEFEKAGVDKNTFAIYWLLKEERTAKAKIIAQAIEGVFRRFPNYRHNVAEMRELKAELYKLLLDAVGKRKMISLAGKLLNIKRLQN